MASRLVTSAGGQLLITSFFQSKRSDQAHRCASSPAKVELEAEKRIRSVSNSRASTSAGATSNMPYTEREPLLTTLVRSAAYADADEAIELLIVPILEERKLRPYIVGLARLRGTPAIIVGTPHHEAAKEVLGLVYGGVSVVCVQADPSVTDLNPPFHQGAQRRSLDMGMGASISSRGGSSTGSLGVYVQKRDTKELCALTAYHVVLSDSADVMCPADEDAATMIRRQRDWMIQEKANLVNYKNMNKVTTVTEDNIAIAHQTIDRLVHDRYIGRVCKTQYHLPTAAEPTYSDVALIKIANPSRLTLTSVKYDIDREIRPSVSFQDPALLAGGHQLTLSGRTSGIRTASLNDYLPVLSIKTHDGTYTLPFRSHAAWNERGDRFSARGDAGAAVVNPADGAVVGIVNAGTFIDFGTVGEHREVDVTLFQSITDIAQSLDIEPVCLFT